MNHREPYRTAIIVLAVIFTPFVWLHQLGQLAYWKLRLAYTRRCNRILQARIDALTEEARNRP